MKIICSKILNKSYLKVIIVFIVLLLQTSVAISIGFLALYVAKDRSYTYKAPVNADIYLDNGILVKYPEVNGIKVNFGFQTLIPADITLLHLSDIREVLAVQTATADPGDQNIKAVSSAINKVFVLPCHFQLKDEKEPVGEFSFNKYLALAGLEKQKNIDAYAKVSGALYSALKKVGLKDADITLGSEFKFRNSLKSSLVIFSSVENDKLSVSIAGSSSPSSPDRGE